MIHIIIGTKAQFIKMAPVIKGLESGGIPFNLINLGQHSETVKKLIKQFDAPVPDFEFSCNRDVVTIPGMIKWALHLVSVVTFRKKYLDEKVFVGKRGVALVHGDTLSTLLALLMAKRAGLKVAHVESGLRSWSFFNPFPEEFIRLICMKFSDFLFAPSHESVSNLKRMGVKGSIFNTEGNTGQDSVRTAIEKIKLRAEESGSDIQAEKQEVVESRLSSEAYVLVSIHRFENLYSRKRFTFILDLVEEISKKHKVVFVMHGPTEKRMQKFRAKRSDSFRSAHGAGGSSRTETAPGASVTYLPLQEYFIFVDALNNAEFVMTDGGSVQEECFYLGKPCLIMRKRSERSEGLGENALLCRFDMKAATQFIRGYGTFRREVTSLKVRPSERLVEEVLKIDQ